MRLLYIATKGEGATDLTIDREVDALSRQFTRSEIEFQPRPATRAESLNRDLSSEDFDILHITAHGEGDRLQVLDGSGQTVMMTAEHIRSFLPRRGRPRPKLIYINACDSKTLAAQLKTEVPFTIGCTLPIENNQAVQGALSFYWRLLIGDSIFDAHAAAGNMVDLLSAGRSEIVLCEQVAGAATEAYFLPKPRILAAFKTGIPARARNWYEIILGVENVPVDTTQVVFFTDDPKLIEYPQKPLGGQLCAIARPTSRGNRSLWCDRDTAEVWDIASEMDLFAAGVTSRQTTWTTTSTLCKALTDWYSDTSGGKNSEGLNDILEGMRNYGTPRR